MLLGDTNLIVRYALAVVIIVALLVLVVRLVGSLTG